MARSSSKKDAGKKEQRKREREERRQRMQERTGETAEGGSMTPPGDGGSAVAVAQPVPSGPRDDDYQQRGAFTIYKPHQGYYVRMSTVVGLAIIFGYGVYWISEQVGISSLQNWNDYLLLIIPGLLIAASILVIYRICGKSHKFVDFFIATENEMRKVNWPSRPEVLNNTKLVLTATLLFALFFLVMDIIFKELFATIGVGTGFFGS